MRIAAAAELAFAAGCAGMTRPFDVRARLGDEFQLARGQVASVGDEPLLVRFTGVPEDSRCAAGTQCIRAGEARVHLELSAPRAPGEDVVLSTAPARPQYASYREYDVRLVALAPERRTDVPHPRYVATLRVTKH